MTIESAADVVATPIGPVTVTVSVEGLRGVAFGDTLGDRRPALGAREEWAAVALTRVTDQLGEYFAGTRHVFEVSVDWSDTNGWQRTVLQTLRETVEHGRTIGYQQLAARAGRPDAARAVGRVMASNPLPIVVPCHRVIAADGGIGGFAGSGGALVELKRRLLEIEGSVPPTLF